MNKTIKCHKYCAEDIDTGIIKQYSDLPSLLADLRKKILYISHGNFVRTKILEDGEFIIDTPGKFNHRIRYRYRIYIYRWTTSE